MKMYLYFFVRGTFTKITKKTIILKINDASLRNLVFNECRMWMYAQLEYKKDEQLFFDRVISCAKNAWEHDNHVLQDFAQYFSSRYFLIIGTLYYLHISNFILSCKYIHIFEV